MATLSSNPSSVVSAGTWLTTTNVYTSDNTYATNTGATQNTEYPMDVGGFDFAAIPAGSTINSVTVTIEAKAGNASRAQIKGELYDSTTLLTGTLALTNLTTADVNYTFTPTATLAQLQSANLKVRVTNKRIVSQATTTSVDYVKIDVDYTPPEPTLTQAAYRFYGDGTETGTLLRSEYSIGLSNSEFSGTRTRIFQSFLGTGTAVLSAQFSLSKGGTPPGNLIARIYSHTGTYGVNGVPTGSPLATSTNSVVADSLTTSYAWISFTFDGSFTTTNGTPYCLALEVDTPGAAPNRVFIRTGSTAPFPGGTSGQFSGTWTSYGSSSAWHHQLYVSSEVAAQDTAYTADVSSGDVNLQLRTRMQVTAYAGFATDDYQLQWEKNASGTWTPLSGVETLSVSEIDSGSTDVYFGAGSFTSIGQSFLGDGRPISKMRMSLRKVGTPVITSIRAYVYAHTGAFGSDTGVPTGSALTTSSTVISVSDLPTTATLTDFFFDGLFVPSNGTPYCLVLDPVGGAGDSNNCVRVRTSSTFNTGSRSIYSAPTWTGSTATDYIFDVYTLVPVAVGPYNSANLTEGAATTNRLTGGTGSFVAGKVSETGLVSDLAISTSNYTELLYSLTLKAADLANGDTLRFRVLRNGATTGLTYTQTPMINITKGAVAATGRPKVWTGSAWATKPAKVWTGSAWVEKPVKVWTGSSWETV